MKKYVVFLRGINVGGNKKVDMKKLKIVFENLDYKNVSTFINSGNIIFETKKVNGKMEEKKLAEKLEKVLEKEFGFEIKVLVRDGEDLQKLCKFIPRNWSNDTEQRTDVLFLWDEFDKKESLKLIKINGEVDNLGYFSGSIIWNFKRINYAKSGMHKFIGTVVYKNMTARNINTVRKLGELLKK